MAPTIMPKIKRIRPPPLEALDHKPQHRKLLGADVLAM